jgi:hypothetical protein
MTLTITITNKDRSKLERLKQWIESALEDWEKDKEPPTKGSIWFAGIKP